MKTQKKSLFPLCLLFFLMSQKMETHQSISDATLVSASYCAGSGYSTSTHSMVTYLISLRARLAQLQDKLVEAMTKHGVETYHFKMREKMILQLREDIGAIEKKLVCQ
jgi:uncharacterized membrane protein